MSTSGTDIWHMINLHELFHDPTLTPGCIMLSAIDALFTLSNLPLSFRNFQFTVENFLGANACFLEPWCCKCRFLHNLLYDGLCRLYWADRANRLSWDYTAR